MCSRLVLFVRSLFNLQDTRPLLRNIRHFTTNTLHCQELFSRFLTFYRKPLWLPPLRTACLGYHSRGRLSRTFFGSFQAFSLRSPAAHLPANSLFTLPHSPPLSTTFFLIFNFFQRFVIPVKKIRAYISPAIVHFFPSLDIYDTLFLYWTNVGQGSAWGVDSPKAFCFCPIPPLRRSFLSPAFSAGVCAIGGHDIHFVLTGSSSSCGSTMPCHDISRISLYLTRCFVCISSSISIRSLSCFTSPPITIM